MGKKRQLAIILLLLLVGLSSAQQPVTTPQVTMPLSVGIPFPPTPGGPPSVIGAGGSATYYYWLVSEFSVGNSPPSGPFAVYDAPNTLSGGNYVFVSWNPVQGATSYDVLRTTSTTAPGGACNCAVIVGTSSTTVNDQSNSLNSYTVQSFQPQSFQLSLANEVVGANTTHLILRRQPSGAQLADLNTVGSGLGDPGSNGIVKRISLNNTSIAAASDVTGLFSGCSGALALLFNGTCGSAGGATNQVNGTNLSSQTTLNFENAATFNGLTFSFTNPSSGNLLPVIGGALGPGGIGTLVAGQNGLANSATTDTTNASNIASGTLAAARVFNPLNQNTTGLAGTATALAGTPSQCSGTQFAQGIAANGNANCATPAGSPAGANFSAQINNGGAFAGAGPGLTGQLLISQGASSPMVVASPGQIPRAVITGTSADTLNCDGTPANTTGDRLVPVLYATGSTVAVTVPAAGAGGCTNTVFMPKLINWKVGSTSYTASTTVTFTTSGGSQFYVANGSSSPAASTTFNLTTGQTATLQTDNNNWAVTIYQGGGGLSGLTQANELIASSSTTAVSGAHVYLSQTSGADMCAKLNTAFTANPNGVVIEGDLGGNQVCSAANAAAAFSNCNNGRYEPIVPTALWLPVTAGTASMTLGNKCWGIFGMGRSAAGSGGTGLSVQACTGLNTPIPGCAAPTVQSYTGFTIAAVAATGGHPGYAHFHGTFSPAPSGGDSILLPCVGASCPGTNSSTANSGRFRVCQQTTPTPTVSVQNDTGCPANPNGTDFYVVNANAATCSSNCGTLYDSSATTLISMGPASSGFGTQVRNIALDCNNILGLTGISNNGNSVAGGPGSSEEDSGWGGLIITSCVDQAEDIHGNQAQNSGPYGPDEIYIPATDAAGGANSNCNLGTTGLFLADTTTRGFMGFTVSAKLGGADCTGASYGVKAANAFYIDSAQNKFSGSMHCEGFSAACFEVGQNSPAQDITMEEVSGMPSGGTSAIDISSNFGNTGLAKFTTGITAIGTKKNTGPTNLLVNNIVSNNTSTETDLGFYSFHQTSVGQSVVTNSEQISSQFSNLIDTALTPGTSPICPNGTGGALSTTGCTASGSTVTVNGGSSLSTANLNGTTPTAGTNGYNVAFQNSGNNVSAEIVGDGNAAHFLNGTGAFSAPSASSPTFDSTSIGAPGATASWTFPNSAWGMTLAGTAPASAGAGTNATTVLAITGPTGGAGSAGNGGNGSAGLSITTGNGGNSTSTNINGSGGVLPITLGAPGTGGSGTEACPGEVTVTNSTGCYGQVQIIDNLTAGRGSGVDMALALFNNTAATSSSTQGASPGLSFTSFAWAGSTPASTQENFKIQSARLQVTNGVPSMNFNWDLPASTHGQVTATQSSFGAVQLGSSYDGLGQLNGATVASNNGSLGIGGPATGTFAQNGPIYIQGQGTDASDTWDVFYFNHAGTKIGGIDTNTVSNGMRIHGGQSGVVGTSSNFAGGPFLITGGVSTGSGNGGQVYIGTTPPGPAGTTENATVNVISVDGTANQVITIGTSSTQGYIGSYLGTTLNSAARRLATNPVAPITIAADGSTGCATCAIGPGSSSANQIASFSGTDGLTLQATAPTVSNIVRKDSTNVLASGASLDCETNTALCKFGYAQRWTGVSDFLCDIASGTFGSYTCASSIGTTPTNFTHVITVPGAATTTTVDGVNASLSIDAGFDLESGTTGTATVTLNLRACASSACTGSPVTLYTSNAGTPTASQGKPFRVSCIVSPQGTTATTMITSCTSVFLGAGNINPVVASVPNSSANWVLVWQLTWGGGSQNDVLAQTYLYAQPTGN